MGYGMRFGGISMSMSVDIGVRCKPGEFINDTQDSLLLDTPLDL